MNCEKPEALESRIINQPPTVDIEEAPHISPSGFHMAISHNTYLINCAIVNPSEDTCLMMKTYMQLTGFINPIEFTNPSAYKDAVE